jgi:AcrR family transcriptional regulator
MASSAESIAGGGPPPARRSPARERVIATALDLFARRGVHGTSLQMIADHLGVTKAAVYHQFNSKEEIVLAVAKVELARFESVVAAAESEPTRKRARDTLLTGMVDMAVDHGRRVSTILSDPVIVGHFADDDSFHDLMRRLRRILLGNDSGPAGRVRTAMLIATISGTVMHPLVVDLDDDILRAELLRLARQFLVVRD